MVPALLSEVGDWLDRFERALDQWEQLLSGLRVAYLRSDERTMHSLTAAGERIQAELVDCKRERTAILDRAAEQGRVVSTISELSNHFDAQWPALWTKRIRAMEAKLNRIQQLSLSLWVSTFQSKTLVGDLLRLLATGRSMEATYAPSESGSHEGGFIVNEAA